MLDNLIFHQNELFLVAIVLFTLTLAVELPYRYGTRWMTDPHVKDEVWNALYAGLLALVAFLLGLSYAQAQGRFDARRQLVLKEADAIETTWLRAAQLPEPQATQFRRVLVRYAKERLQAYDRPWQQTAFEQRIAKSDSFKPAMWSIASKALQIHPGSLGLSLLMQSLNETIDLSSDQVAALTQHIPASVIGFTFLLVILGTIFTGFSFARKQGRPRVFAAIYILALTLVLQMIVDFDRPQTGFVRVSLEPLRETIATMER